MPQPHVSGQLMGPLACEKGIQNPWLMFYEHCIVLGITVTARLLVS